MRKVYKKFDLFSTQATLYISMEPWCTARAYNNK